MGTATGQLMIFEGQTERDVETFTDKRKDFVGNAVTCIDVHFERTGNVVLGYERGQLLLLDIYDLRKAMKTVKDSHKGVPVANVKFCDYQNESEREGGKEIQHWMFASVDTNGKVVISTVQKKLMIFTVVKHVLVKSIKGAGAGEGYFSIAVRFSHDMYPSPTNDSATLLAIGNTS